jgi:hypothetical protein
VYTEDVWPITRQLRLQRVCGDAVGRLARRQEQIVTDSYWVRRLPGRSPPQQTPTARDDLDIFSAKVRRRGENTLGLFIAINGFELTAIEIHQAIARRSCSWTAGTFTRC